MIIEVQRRSHIQRMTYDEFEARIRDGEIPPETPIRFEVVTGEDFRPAGDLELYQALVDPRQQTFRRGLTRAGIPIATAILVGIQCRIYLWSWIPDLEGWMQEHLTNWAPAILEQGEAWRLLSYGLLHISFTHLLFNLCFLAYTGYNLERALGRINLLLLYFGSVFGGGLLSMSMAPDRPSLGASGGDFGLIAAAVVFGWKHWDDIPASARKKFGWALAPYLGFSLLSGLSSENVDNWGHLGGLISGVILMTFLSPEVMVDRIRRNRQVRWIAVGLMIAATAVVFALGPRLVPLTEMGDRGWEVAHPTYWREGWTFTGDRGWFSPTGRATLVAATTVHPRPLSNDDAAQNLVDRIGAGGKNPEVLRHETIRVQGWEARRLTLRFDLSDTPHRVDALVLARGVFEHRVQFQVVEDSADRLVPLAERIFEGLRLTEPTELLHARKRALIHPRSWEPATELGDALYRAGEPSQALVHYERAQAIAPNQPRPMVGRLRVYADYHLPVDPEFIDACLAAAPGDTRVVVAAADLLYELGEYDNAIALLDATWADHPGDRALRRTRLQWGLSVE